MSQDTIKTSRAAQLAMNSAYRYANLQSRVTDLAREIDDLSKPENLGVWGLKESLRQLGYDVDADLAALGQRGVDA